MSIGVFFVVFFALIAAGIIWIARSPNSRPLSQEETRSWEQEEEYWVWFNPSGPVRSRRDDD